MSWIFTFILANANAQTCAEVLSAPTDGYIEQNIHVYLDHLKITTFAHVEVRQMVNREQTRAFLTGTIRVDPDDPNRAILENPRICVGRKCYRIMASKVSHTDVDAADVIANVLGFSAEDGGSRKGHWLGAYTLMGTGPVHRGMIYDRNNDEIRPLAHQDADRGSFDFYKTISFAIDGPKKYTPFYWP